MSGLGGDVNPFADPNVVLAANNPPPAANPGPPPAYANEYTLPSPMQPAGVQANKYPPAQPQQQPAQVQPQVQPQFQVMVVPPFSIFFKRIIVYLFVCPILLFQSSVGCGVGFFCMHETLMKLTWSTLDPSDKVLILPTIRFF